jgi:UDP-N-acetylglucosamine 2-epimerase
MLAKRCVCSNDDTDIYYEFLQIVIANDMMKNSSHYYTIATHRNNNTMTNFNNFFKAFFSLYRLSGHSFVFSLSFECHLILSPCCYYYDDKKWQK